jgi:FdhD/NarQ family
VSGSSGPGRDGGREPQIHTSAASRLNWWLLPPAAPIGPACGSTWRCSPAHRTIVGVEAGQLLVAREDVGRHNAVDKVLGWALLADRIPATDTVLMVSGRAFSELARRR